MNAQTSKQIDEPMVVFEYRGDRDVPTIVSPGDGKTYNVVEGCFEAPARFAQALGYLGFATREARVKPKANGKSRGIEAKGA